MTDSVGVRHNPFFVTSIQCIEINMIYAHIALFQLSFTVSCCFIQHFILVRQRGEFFLGLFSNLFGLSRVNIIALKGGAGGQVSFLVPPLPSVLGLHIV